MEPSADTGACPWTPACWRLFKPLIKQHVEQNTNQVIADSLQGSLSRHSTNYPLNGANWCVSLSASRNDWYFYHSRLCSSYPSQPLSVLWRCFISGGVYLSCWHLKAPLRASQGVFLIYGNCLTRYTILGLLTSNDYSFSLSACYISSSRRNPWSDT